MTLYQATKGRVCAGFVVGQSKVTQAAPILGGKSLEGKLGWWVIKQLERKGYTVTRIGNP
jgi:hypothetical protein